MPITRDTVDNILSFFLCRCAMLKKMSYMVLIEFSSKSEATG